MNKQDRASTLTGCVTGLVAGLERESRGVYLVLQFQELSVEQGTRISAPVIDAAPTARRDAKQPEAGFQMLQFAFEAGQPLILALLCVVRQGRILPLQSYAAQRQLAPCSWLPVFGVGCGDDESCSSPNQERNRSRY